MWGGPFRAALKGPTCTAADFSAASRRTYAAAASPARIDSSTSGATISNAYPAARNNSARRGEPDARISRTDAMIRSESAIAAVAIAADNQ